MDTPSQQRRVAPDFEWKARVRVDWFGLNARRTMPKRGPRWFVSRGANYAYVCLGGFCAVTVPLWWDRAGIEARGYDRGWNAGLAAGMLAARRDRIEPIGMCGDAPITATDLMAAMAGEDEDGE